MPSPKELLVTLFSHIESNLESGLSLERLEAESGLSRFALTRLFIRFTGMPPMEYVRARRLACSLPGLLRGDAVLDVALSWGFEYEQSYIRAFKAAYGVTPARFRKYGGTAPVVEPPRLEGFTVSSGGMLGKPDIVVRPAFELNGCARDVNYADNLLWGKPLYEGVCAAGRGDYTAAYRQTGTFVHRYLTCAGAAGETWRFPAGRWAQFRYVGLHALDADGARRARLMTQLVVGSWQRENAFQANHMCIERVAGETRSDAYCEVEMLFPLGAFSPDGQALSPAAASSVCKEDTAISGSRPAPGAPGTRAP